MRQQMRAFDTYTHINELKEAGFNEKQAAVIIKSLVDSRETDISHLATREQVNELKNANKDQFNELKTDIALIKEQIKSFATKEDLKDIQINLIKWMVGSMIAFSGVMLAGIKLL
jgi:capsule polysaccharide export protein KpsE/RkpR